MKKIIQSFLDLASLYFSPAVTNSSANTTTASTNDVSKYIASKLTQLSQRNLIAYQFGAPLRLEKGRGTTYYASRFERLPLPANTLTEGGSSAGQAITLTQVSASAQQWGDLVRITDVLGMTTAHPVFQNAVRMIHLQQAETIERNTISALLSSTAVTYAGFATNNSNTNYATTATTRAGLTSTSFKLDPAAVAGVVGTFATLGVPFFSGTERPDMKADANAHTKASSAPSAMPHYVALIHPLVEQDMRQNTTVSNAWSYSDVNRLYNSDLGEWGGVRFCRSNMIPFWTNAGASPAGTPSNSGGVLTNAASPYYIIVTAAKAATSVEEKIYAVTSGITIASGTTGSISLTLPTLANYVFNVYIGTTTTPNHLATVAGADATGLASGAAIVVTGISSTVQVPPAIPATGMTVYPTIFIGESAYGQVLLEDAEYFYLKDADKTDPQNTTRVVSWKMFYGTIILNSNFIAVVESTSEFSPVYEVTPTNIPAAP